ncbi:MAG: hypothetical protein RDU20_18350 [Desulfomonilaceae bacterium]|nr:hypothetical protein [Desulfomonilaceae bacterium]
MAAIDSLTQIRSKVKELKRLAQDLYVESEDFPAINRNAKRVLASVEMMRIGTEQESEETG